MYYIYPVTNKTIIFTCCQQTCWTHSYLISLIKTLIDGSPRHRVFKPIAVLITSLIERHNCVSRARLLCGFRGEGFIFSENQSCIIYVRRLIIHRSGVKNTFPPHSANLQKANDFNIHGLREERRATVAGNKKDYFSSPPAINKNAHRDKLHLFR